MMTDIEVVHVPYRGAPAAHSALLAGDVHAVFDAIGSSAPQIKSGALRALGVTAPLRRQVLPDIPPIGDFVPGFAVTGWLGIGLPKGTPIEIVERLNLEVNTALADRAVRARMSDLGSEPLSGSAADFANLVAEETEKWAKAVNLLVLRQNRTDQTPQAYRGAHMMSGICGFQPAPGTRRKRDAGRAGKSSGHGLSAVIAVHLPNGSAPACLFRRRGSATPGGRRIAVKAKISLKHCVEIYPWA